MSDLKLREYERRAAKGDQEGYTLAERERTRSGEQITGLIKLQNDTLTVGISGTYYTLPVCAFRTQETPTQTHQGYNFCYANNEIHFLYQSSGNWGCGPSSTLVSINAEGQMQTRQNIQDRLQIAGNKNFLILARPNQLMRTTQPLVGNFTPLQEICTTQEIPYQEYLIHGIGQNLQWYIPGDCCFETTQDLERVYRSNIKQSHKLQSLHNYVNSYTEDGRLAIFDKTNKKWHWDNGYIQTSKEVMGVNIPAKSRLANLTHGVTPKSTLASGRIGHEGSIHEIPKDVLEGLVKAYELVR